MRTVAAAMIALMLVLGCFAAAGCGRQLSEEEKEFLEDAIYHEIKRDVSGEKPDATEEADEEPEEEEEEAEPEQDTDDYYELLAGQYVREDYSGDQNDLHDKYMMLKADCTYEYGLAMIYHTGTYEADPEEETIILDKSSHPSNKYEVKSSGGEVMYLIDSKGRKWNKTVIEIEVPESAF